MIAATGRKALHDLRAVLELLFPAACVGCGGRIASSGPSDLVCAPCRSRLRPLPSPGCLRCGFPVGTGVAPAEGCLECQEWQGVLHGGVSACELRPPADALVHALKYGGWERVADLMGRRMAGLDLSDLGGWTGWVVPVPTTPRRLRARGYNQAERLARTVARHRGLTLVDALERGGAAATQVALHPTERRANVEGAFRVRAQHARTLEGKPVLLVDDVLTTGATVTAAARALQNVHVARVIAVTFARALPYRDAREAAGS